MERFGKYALLDKIAAGGMAEVYLAKSLGAEGVNKFVAIKRILPQFSEHEEFISMFKEEAKIAVNISHSNVVSIYDFGEENNRFYLVMEYVQGRNLRQLINRLKKQENQLPIEMVAYIINEVTKGLDHAHKCFDKTTGRPLNIIHRDISPQNFMLSFDGEVKLLDFGIAKAESKIETTRAGTLKGKFGYMSPEQAEGLELDFRTDIFSLGIVLWELLANERLFMANNEMNTIRKIRECHIPELQKINPQVHDELERITNKALARDRSLRYQSAGDMHKDLNKYLNQHFPDLTSHDFAQYLKRIYDEEIMEIREKLIEFASQVVSNKPNTNTNNNRNNNINNDNFFQRPQNVVLSSDLNNTSNVYPSNSNMPVPSDISSPGYDHSKKSNVQRAHFTTTRTANSNSFTMPLLLIAIASVVAFFLFKDDPSMNQVLKNIKSGDESGSNISASKEGRKLNTSIKFGEQFSYQINSTPSGAAIYINGRDTGFYTPGRIMVRPNSSFVVTLRKDNYLPYTKQLSAKANGQQFRATLQKAQVGYISVDVRPGQAELSINGVKLSEKPPLKKYAVPANETILIRAYNPTSGAEATQSIAVKQDTHQQLTLFLKKKN